MEHGPRTVTRPQGMLDESVKPSLGVPTAGVSFIFYITGTVLMISAVARHVQIVTGQGALPEKSMERGKRGNR